MNGINISIVLLWIFSSSMILWSLFAFSCLPVMDDQYFMRLAMVEANVAPFPFGCILVKDNEVIATGRSGEGSYDPTAHAEVNAIRSACTHLQSIDLSGTTLYSTCEPCPMCFSASWWAKIDRIVF